MGQGRGASEVMVRLTLAAALFAIAGDVTCAQAGAAFPIEEVDRWLDKLHATHGFSGAVVIERDGSVVYSRGIGAANAETGRSFTPDTPTDGAALAKPFTAASLLMLVEDGSIDLQAPVKKYVTEYPDATTAVFDLLSHRAPLPDYAAFSALMKQGKPVTTPALLAEAERMSASAPPAAAGAYRYADCGLCLDTAALVVERVTGKRFDAVLRQQIFFHLGIENAFIRQPRLSALPADRAVGYRTLDGRRERYDAEDFEAFYGGGNLYASARDLARFARAHAIPPPRNARFALSGRALWPVVPAGGLSYGLTLGNWYCENGALRCYYPGLHRGFYNVMYWDRAKRITVVYVSNSGIAPWLRSSITRELVAAAEGGSITQPVEPKLATLTDEKLRGALGIYDVPGAGRVTLLHDAGKHYVRSDIGLLYPLHRVSPTLFYVPGLDAYVGLGEDSRLSWTTVFLESYGVRVAS
jgi:CubicO group peptidase (beta-lactamase class C family)